MKRGQQSASDEEFRRRLNAALALHSFLLGAPNVQPATNTSNASIDKDVFRIFFMRALAKRLLLQRSASDDFEKSFLTRLGKGNKELYNDKRALTSSSHPTRL